MTRQEFETRLKNVKSFEKAIRITKEEQEKLASNKPIDEMAIAELRKLLEAPDVNIFLQLI